MKYKDEILTKTKELAKLMAENPELPIVPMVDQEICDGTDFNYTLGQYENCKKSKICITVDIVYEYSEDDEIRASDAAEILYSLIDYEPAKFEGIKRILV